MDTLPSTDELAKLAITSYLACLAREGVCYNSRLSNKSKEKILYKVYTGELNIVSNIIYIC